MSKPSDLTVLKRAFAALLQSSSPRMLRANLDYLWDRLVVHPSKDVQQKFYAPKAR